MDNLGGFGNGGSLSNNYAPPRCTKHNRQPVLSFYQQTGDKTSVSGWACPDCISEETKWGKIDRLLKELREAIEEAKKS